MVHNVDDGRGLKAAGTIRRLRLVEVIGWPRRKRLALGHLERPQLPFPPEQRVGPVVVVTPQEVINRAGVGERPAPASTLVAGTRRAETSEEEPKAEKIHRAPCHSDVTQPDYALRLKVS